MKMLLFFFQGSLNHDDTGIKTFSVWTEVSSMCIWLFSICENSKNIVDDREHLFTGNMDLVHIFTDFSGSCRWFLASSCVTEDRIYRCPDIM